MSALLERPSYRQQSPDVAELIGSERGIGHMITDSQALLNTGQIIFGIIVIGAIGLVSDYAFKSANRRMFRWAA